MKFPARRPRLLPPAPRTLRGRLSLAALTTAALVMLLLTVAFNTVVRQHLQRQADDELRARATAVAATVDTRGPAPRVLEVPDDTLLDTNAWIYADDRLLEQPPSSATSPLTRTAATLARQGGRRCVTAGGDDPVRLCVRAGRAHGSVVTVVTALSLSPYESSAGTLLLASLVLDAVMLLGTYLITQQAVGRALRPVSTMSDQATQWSAVASQERFGALDRPLELARLGASLDALLDRTRAVLRHERRLTGELSHELRTPLSRIIAELDWWQMRPRSATETRAVHDTIADAARSMHTICDTLLRDARDNATTAPGTADVLPTLRRLTEALPAPAHVTTTLTDPGRPVLAEVMPALLERIVCPVLANAHRYARSTVTVLTSQEPGGVCIAVTDDGPGVPPSFAGRLFQPGRRADPGDGHSGAGLGLPLARRLARSAGGDVTHDPDHGPGARFLITLPMSSHAPAR
ncbi:two-component sensor histidine kinase [Streptomyces sp. Ru73]|uniref:sensor histidine kinase n=1 Tax=Streptomyces sp. Ru73 TaxID=2080748 RepID=UPI000CDE400D|nr:HAMP domain-containing sensor histidine kinase [Streptomyces sp. Ru73]POX42418.1 two-component sensor histidine kinase [Streptomyces sp. Ru73]